MYTVVVVASRVGLANRRQKRLFENHRSEKNPTPRGDGSGSQAVGRKPTETQNRITSFQSGHSSFLLPPSLTVRLVLRYEPISKPLK